MLLKVGAGNTLGLQPGPQPNRANVRWLPQREAQPTLLPAALNAKCSDVFANIFMLFTLQRKIDLNLAISPSS